MLASVAGFFLVPFAAGLVQNAVKSAKPDMDEKTSDLVGAGVSVVAAVGSYYAAKKWVGGRLGLWAGNAASNGTLFAKSKAFGALNPKLLSA